MKAEWVEAGVRALDIGMRNGLIQSDSYVAAVIAAVEQLIRADERAERGLANEPQGLALAEMLLHASRATEAKVRAQIAADIEALPVDGAEGPRGRVVLVRDIRARAYRDAARIARGEP